MIDDDEDDDDDEHGAGDRISPTACIFLCSCILRFVSYPIPYPIYIYCIRHDEKFSLTR